MTEKSFEQRLAECEQVLRKLEGTGNHQERIFAQRNAAVNPTTLKTRRKDQADRLWLTQGQTPLHKALY
jgi:hypothetical protein